MIAKVSERRAEPLFEGTVLRLYDVTCRAKESAPAEEEHTLTTQVILPLRGCFEVHRGRDVTVADPVSAVIFRAGDDHRIGHPAADGDECVVFALPPESAEDAVGSNRTAGIAGLVEPDVRSRLHGARAALRDGAVDPLAAEEEGLDLLRSVLRGLPRREDSGRGALGRTQRSTVERTRVLLASRPAERWRLDQIAREVFISPWHLARLFRTATGESISRYLLRLRLGVALDRLAGGERDLAALSLELGFAHHSHFSARFRAMFGVTPSAFRSSLTTDRLARSRTIVTAPDLAPT
jgi:AraC family transcriptional regulator